MRTGTVFGQALLAGAIATAVFALAGAGGMLPVAVAQRPGPEHRDRDHGGSAAAGMEQIVEVLRREGFSEPYSLEREHGLIEAEATGRDGRRYEIYIDPKTGRILETEEED